MNITANQVKQKFLSRFTGMNIIIPEFGYYDGMRGTIILDLIRFDLTKHRIIGYEIKLTREDLRKDDKWYLYSDLCQKFYFIVPEELVKSTRELIPEEVGVIGISEVKHSWKKEPDWEFKIRRRGKNLSGDFKNRLEYIHYSKLLELALHKLFYRGALSTMIDKLSESIWTSNWGEYEGMGKGSRGELE